MAKDKESKDDVGTSEVRESNAERDQDHGNMNNGTLGGSMGVIGPEEQIDTESKDRAEEQGRIFLRMG